MAYGCLGCNDVGFGCTLHLVPRCLAAWHREPGEPIPEESAKQCNGGHQAGPTLLPAARVETNESIEISMATCGQDDGK